MTSKNTNTIVIETKLEKLKRDNIDFDFNHLRKMAPAKKDRTLQILFLKFVVVYQVMYVIMELV